MHDSYRSIEPVPRKLPVPDPSVIVLVALLWLTFACALPIHQVKEERRRAHQELSRVLALNRADQTSVVDAFDRANQNLDAAAAGPCILLACIIIFMVNQLLKLKRQYHALAHEMEAPHVHHKSG